MLKTIWIENYMLTGIVQESHIIICYYNRHCSVKSNWIGALQYVLLKCDILDLNTFVRTRYIYYIQLKENQMIYSYIVYSTRSCKVQNSSRPSK